MRFTDRKGIKIYCCVSFSPCKVWIKCHTLACELLNELVCSLWCGPCKYPSWVWNGDCLVWGWGLTRIGECGTYLSVAPTIRPQQGTGVPNSSIDWLRVVDVPHLKWQIVTDWKAPWWLWCLVILGKAMIDRHSQNEMSDMRCQNESTRGQIQVWVERNACVCVNMHGYGYNVTLVECSSEILTINHFIYELSEVLCTVNLLYSYLKYRSV